MPARRRFHLVVLALFMLASAALQLVFRDWWIEDAAISFAYARNLVAGEGLVAVAGMERIEGYSNPTWVALLALFQVVRIDGFVASKILGVVFGAATVPVTWAIARTVNPEPDDDRPLLAAGLVALNPQLAIWNASGLENSLFCFLLAFGIWRTLQETAELLDPVRPRPSRLPLAASAFFLLAITRPEGIAYAAVGGLFAMLFTLADGLGPWPTIRWLTAFFLPWGAYQLWHYQYFAWSFPNTYYAKMGDKEFRPFAWDARGWAYLRGYAFETGQGFFIPAYFFGLLGHDRSRRWVAAALAALYTMLLLLPGPDFLKKSSWWPHITAPEGWIESRIVVLLVIAALVPVLAIGRRQSRALVMGWYLALVSAFFVIWSGGDWMKGYRWLSLSAVPISLVLGQALAEVAQVLSRLRRPRERWFIAGFVAALALLIGVSTPGFFELSTFRKAPETSPYSVKKRVEYKQYVARRLHLDHVRDFDVDQGAHLWWSGFDMYDLAGLVDVPMAHHDFEKPFLQEYILGEVRPDFAHLHGGWGATSGLPRMPLFKDAYHELPGYPSGKKNFHIGNYVRRDLINRDRWDGPEGREIRYRGDIGIVGWDLPAKAVGVSRSFYLEVAMRSALQKPFRALVFVDDDAGHLQSWSLAPGYDWLDVPDWRPDEVFVGRFTLDLSRDMPEGTYDLGFVLTDADGAVLQLAGAQQLAMADGTVVRRPGAPDDAIVGHLGDGTARFAEGEVRFPGAFVVISKEEARKQAGDDVDAARAAAAQGGCEDSERLWRLARQKMVRDEEWVGSRKAKTWRALSQCWTARASGATDDATKVDALTRAHGWDHRDPELRAAAESLASTLYGQGIAARDAEDWETAYRRFADLLQFAPHWSWARRYAEEARDKRLGIDKMDKPPPGARSGAPRLQPLKVPVAPDLDNE